MNTISKIILLLDNNNKTQKELTDYLGIDKSTFTAWKNGKSKSYNKYIKKISEFFNTSIDYFIADKIRFDFSPREDDDYLIQCPICGNDCCNDFIRSLQVDFDNDKSDGIALEFYCQGGHLFYYLVESYKGKTYIARTDKNSILDNTADINGEVAQISLSTALGDFEYEKYRKKYHVLDEHGKDVVDKILDLEYTRIIEQKRTVLSREIKHSLYKVSAGTGAFIDNEDAWDTINVPDTALSQQADYVLTIIGDSMEPKYHSGERIFVKSVGNIDIGEIGIFILNGESYIKKLGRNKLISLNPNYSDIELSEFDSIECKGKVIGNLNTSSL